MTEIRRVHRELVRELRSRAQLSGHCWLVSTHYESALIVPTPHGAYEHVRTFRRATIQDALDKRLIGLTRKREPMPEFTCSSKPGLWVYLAEGGGLRIWEGGDR